MQAGGGRKASSPIKGDGTGDLTTRALIPPDAHSLVSSFACVHSTDSAKTCNAARVTPQSMLKRYDKSIPQTEQPVGRTFAATYSVEAPFFHRNRGLSTNSPAKLSTTVSYHGEMPR